MIDISEGLQFIFQAHFRVSIRPKSLPRQDCEFHCINKRYKQMIIICYDCFMRLYHSRVLQSKFYYIILICSRKTLNSNSWTKATVGQRNKACTYWYSKPSKRKKCEIYTFGGIQAKVGHRSYRYGTCTVQVQSTYSTWLTPSSHAMTSTCMRMRHATWHGAWGSLSLLYSSFVLINTYALCEPHHPTHHEQNTTPISN